MDRSNPFSDVDAFFERMGRRFDFDEMPRGRMGRWNRAAVPMDFEDEGEAFVLTADLPGFEKSDIEVTVEGQTLTLSAHREHEREHEREREREGMYIRRERRSESVSRSVHFPADVDADAASATYTNGVLTVTVPKVHVGEDEGHRIDVE